MRGRSLGKKHGLGVQDRGNFSIVLFSIWREEEKEDMWLFGVCICVLRATKDTMANWVVGLANLEM